VNRNTRIFVNSHRGMVGSALLRGVVFRRALPGQR